MSQSGNRKLPLENFLLSPGSISPRKQTDSMDIENSQEICDIKQSGKELSTNALNQIRSSSTLTVCPSPQLAPSPQSGPRSVPPYFPYHATSSPTHPPSPATASPKCDPVLGNFTPFQFKRISRKTSPRQFHSDGETSHRPSISKHGQRMLLQRSLSNTVSKASARPNSSNRTSSQTFSLQRRISSQTGLLHSDDGMRDNSTSLYSVQPIDVNHNVVPATLHFLSNQNQTAQSRFLSHSSSTILHPKLEQQWSQDSLPTDSSPSIIPSHVMLQSGAVSPPFAQSDISGSSKQQQTVFSGSSNFLASHSSDPNLALETSQSFGQESESLNCQNESPLATILSKKSETGNNQVPPVSFAQSYTNLTPWTTRLAAENQNSFLNINEEALPLSLGVTDNLLLSASAKENRPETQENYSLFDQPYGCLQGATTDSDGLVKQVKETKKALPNKQLRFRKTADALQKSGLWEVAMKTGNLIRRNKELQKELDKFRADALIFLKSVIKNPHNWRLIKNILSNALSANQASNKASPIMTVVVSAAHTAAAASAKLDSAGSSSGSSSLCGNVSDSSGSNSNSFGTAFVDNHFASTKHEFSCVAMDVN